MPHDAEETTLIRMVSFITLSLGSAKKDQPRNLKGGAKIEEGKEEKEEGKKETFRSASTSGWQQDRRLRW